MKRQNYLRALTGLLIFSVGAMAHAAEGPPTSNGIISNPTLVANQDVAKAQAVGAITTFMSQGAQECDANGKNCHSVFGQDDTPDYSGLQAQSQELTGISAFSYLGASGNSEDGGNSNAVASQLGTLAVACGDTSVKKVAGIAVKLTSCTVNTTGDAQITYQVCTAPSRQNPITPPKNAVPCSTDPSAPNFVAPEGKVCARPACDTEPLNSLDGWSAPQTVSWQATLPSNATADQQTNNGLGLTFYPNPTGGVLSLSTDADNMTAVKVIQTFIDNSTKKTAVGLKVAYRHQTQVTKDMMTQGPSSVPNPSANSAAWDTIEKLQGNALIPQYQQTYGANGADCLTQIQSGIGKDGKITVCDTNYTNESGIKPIAKTAQVAAEGEDCGTTPQCLNKVVNTQTWTEQCNADVPLAERNCSTTQDYTIDHMSYTRERSKEVCEEKRTNAQYGCTTSAVPETVVPYWSPLANLSADGSTSVQTVLDFTRDFTTPIKASVIGAAITAIHADNWMEIRLNGTRIWANLDGNLNSVLNGDTYTNCGNDTWTVTETYYDYDGYPQTYTYQQSGVRCTMQDGSRVQANYSDACGTYCKWDNDQNQNSSDFANNQAFYAVNIPVDPSLIRLSADNILEVACFNNEGPSACDFAMSIEYIPWTSFTVNDQCSGYEAAK
ncbi:hypothetical protein [Paraburkholderia sp. A3RO-2L]|uniref:hypothetical protein n=1 Tax=unclassified Paraburkholderia TaxID=2615204 RepID=UPI003DA8A50F